MEDKYLGQQFGCYKIVSKTLNKTKDGHIIYVGICVGCGKEKKDRILNFTTRDLTKECNHNNGKFCNEKLWDNKRLEEIFNGMVSRCYKNNAKDFRFYGEKNIHICNEWLDNPVAFEQWSLNNGYQDNLTIDRIDETKDYCPENCRWITHLENSKFKSTTNCIEVNGIIDSGRGWAKRLDLPINFINTYLKNYGLTETIVFIQSKI